MSEIKGKLFLIVGPSGVGKGTIIKLIKEKYPDFDYPISATTRDIRPGERDGETYHFINKLKFEKMIKNGELLEYAIVHGEEYYGTLKKSIMKALTAGHVVIREVDMQGCESIKRVLPKENLVSIFLTVPNKEDLISRILKRGKLPQEEIKRRMESAEKEFAKGGRICDYPVDSLNGKVDECFKQVEKIILDEAKGIYPYPV
ncbi:guanylate kinase [Patescibacteria group bacterium]|nr:guanylate kinase [Patescibacteria group bacterium]